jgi:hypothetical protein
MDTAGKPNGVFFIHSHFEHMVVKERGIGGVKDGKIRAVEFYQTSF